MTMHTTLPEPPVPADLDLRRFPYMPLHVQRLRDSDLAVLSSGDEFRAAVLLWCASWHQVPASSLPKDDRLLAKLAGYGRDVQGWLAVKETALRGFIECSDGLLYHHLIADTALESDVKKRKRQSQTEAARKAKSAKPSAENSLCNRDQKKRREKKDGGDDDARAREARVVSGETISREATEIADELAIIAGHSLQTVPLSWCGAARRVDIWLREDPRWTREIILMVARNVMARKKDGPPQSVNYFEKPIAKFIAQQSAPVATVEIDHGQYAARTHEPTARRNPQDTLVAGMASALARCPASRLSQGAAGDVEGDRVPALPPGGDDPEEPRAVA